MVGTVMPKVLNKMHASFKRPSDNNGGGEMPPLPWLLPNANVNAEEPTAPPIQRNSSQQLNNGQEDAGSFQVVIDVAPEKPPDEEKKETKKERRRQRSIGPKNAAAVSVDVAAAAASARAEGLTEDTLVTVVKGTFKEVGELQEWLAMNGVDTSHWGSGKAKEAKENGKIHQVKARPGMPRKQRRGHLLT